MIIRNANQNVIMDIKLYIKIYNVFLVIIHIILTHLNQKIVLIALKMQFVTYLTYMWIKDTGNTF